MWPIGTRSSGWPGQRPAHIARDTRPCSADTALARCDSFSASTVMQNVSWSLLGIDAAEGQQPLAVEAQRLAQRAEVLLDEIGREAVVAGRDRRVRGETDVRGDHAQRLVRRQPLALHPLAPELERGEGAVAFVQVVDAGRVAERPQRPRAADAEHQLLADAGPLVAAVEPRRQLAILGRLPSTSESSSSSVVRPTVHRPHPRRDRCRCASRRSPSPSGRPWSSPAGSAASRRRRRGTPPAGTSGRRAAAGSSPGRRRGRRRPAGCRGRTPP